MDVFAWSASEDLSPQVGSGQVYQASPAEEEKVRS